MSFFKVVIIDIILKISWEPWVKNEIDHILGIEDEKDCCFSSMKKNARMQESVKLSLNISKQFDEQILA